ncbi:MAG TPA: hypothetical protein PLN61_09935, partial [bacterium]|nr:hypothetical protein [bacterium]
MRIGKLLSAGMLLVMVTVPTGFAQIPRLISYQGRLTDANGRAISDTTTFTFTFYRCAATSTPLWSESQQVLVQDGIFNVSLGQIVPLELSFDEPYCLGITVNGGLEMQPLIPLNAVAYSMRSLYADSLAAGAVTGDKIQTGTVVRSVNTLTDHVTLQAGENITITSTGDTLRISAKVDAGPGDIKLPYSGMVTSSTPAFSLTNTGDGLAGEFISDNPGSTLGMRISASGSGHALYAFNKGTGHAAYFNITNLTSTSTTLEAINDALGKAASFSIANADNTSPALECRTEGQGPAFVAHQEGPSSRIAEFKGDGAVRAYINKAGDLVTAGNISFTSIPQILLSGSSSAPLKLEMSGTGEADLFVEGKIGIGISAPSEKLHVAGMIYSTSGGFKFPDGTVQTTAARNSSADISAISAGNGLTGGGLSGDINLDVGAGLGISVTADAVSLNTSYTDGLYINEGQANSVTGAMILDGTVQTTDLAFIPPDGYSLDAADGSPANAVYVDNGG